MVVDPAADEGRPAARGSSPGGHGDLVEAPFAVGRPRVQRALGPHLDDAEAAVVNPVVGAQVAVEEVGNVPDADR